MSITNLLPHQLNTLEHIEQKCTNQKGLLLWHYMGTGKTITGLAWLHHIITNYTQDDYLIVCPPLIKVTWIMKARDMGIEIKEKNILNYSDVRNMIENTQDIIKNKYIIMDEAHTLGELIRELTTENRTYYMIHSYISQCKKILLLSGTPFDKQKSDLAILLNLCANEPFMPISEDKWNDKYTDKSIFEENKQNPIFFNYIMPVVSKYGHSLLSNYIYPVIHENVGDSKSINEHIYTIGILPVLMLLKSYTIYPVTDKIQNKLIDYSESDTMLKIQNKLGRFDPFSSILKTFINYTERPSAVESSNVITHAIMWAIISMIVWYFVNMVWGIVYDYFTYNNNDVNYANWLDIKFDEVAADSKQYISYYKFENDPFYAKVTLIKDPFRSILSISTMTITIQFYFGKVAPKLLSFITGRSIQDLNLDSSLVLNSNGFSVYGRVLSNLPEFIEKLLNNSNNSNIFSINSNTGAITLNFIQPAQIVQQSSTKFQTLATHIIALNNSKKIFIYSDYVQQGAYLFSAYLTAMNIEHIYLNPNITTQEQQALLELFNKDFKYNIIILDKHSKEGISLLNIEEVHFLEPPINIGGKEQVIGRAVRYNSHKDLPLERKAVSVYTHSSSIFRTPAENLTWLEKIKTMDIKKILFGDLVEKYYNKTANYQINEIIQSQKIKHFKGIVQTTFSYYLDQYLDIGFNRTVQGESIYGSRKASTKKDSNNIDKKTDKKTDKQKSTSQKYEQNVVLSIDEHCEKMYLSKSGVFNIMEDLLKEDSVSDNKFFIKKKYHCSTSNKKINTKFFPKKLNVSQGGSYKQKNSSKKNILSKKKSIKLLKKYNY